MTRKELLYLLILLAERAKSKDDLSGADDDVHTLQTQPTDRAVARGGQLMGSRGTFGGCRAQRLLAVEAIFQTIVSAANRLSWISCFIQL